jgi:hypothetical protein
MNGSQKPSTSYSNLELLCSHVHAEGTNWRWSTNINHYPPKAQIDSDFLIASLLKKARLVGANAEILCQRRLLEPKHPFKHLRSMQALIALNQKYTNEQIDNACSMALRFDKLSMAYIRDGLKNSIRTQTQIKKQQTLIRAPQRQLNLSCLQGGIS